MNEERKGVEVISEGGRRVRYKKNNNNGERKSATSEVYALDCRQQRHFTVG